MAKLIARACYVLTAFAFLPSAKAHAGVAAELFYGIESAPWRYSADDDSVKTKTMKGSEVGAAFSLSPIPLVPISFGLKVSSHSFDTSSLNKDTVNNGESTALDVTASGKVTGLTYGPEIVAWLPLHFFRPFLRIGYSLGNYKDTSTFAATALSSVSPSLDLSTGYTSQYSSTGTELGAGLLVSPLPLVGMFFEYHRINEVHKMTSMQQTSSGTTEAVNLSTVPSGLKEQRYSATSLRIGIQVGI